MNPTLRKFGCPDSIIRAYRHWVVMLRPKQITYGCVVIASTSNCTSLGDLTPQEAAEFPDIARHFEATLRRLAGAEKFNYLALMMVDPNPHFHAIPRYSREVLFDGLIFRDPMFPKPPDINVAHELDAGQLDATRKRLLENWVLREPLINSKMQGAPCAPIDKNGA